jgi:hypothetical protein
MRAFRGLQGRHTPRKKVHIPVQTRPADRQPGLNASVLKKLTLRLQDDDERLGLGMGKKRGQDQREGNKPALAITAHRDARGEKPNKQRTWEGYVSFSARDTLPDGAACVARRARGRRMVLTRLGQYRTFLRRIAET